MTKLTSVDFSALLNTIPTTVTYTKKAKKWKKMVKEKPNG
jgi:hypothetical protein